MLYYIAVLSTCVCLSEIVYFGAISEVAFKLVGLLIQANDLC